LISLYCVWAFTFRNPTLDASTVQTYLNGVSGWHEQARQETGLPLLNPKKTSSVRLTLAVALRHYKKPSKAKRPISIEQWKAVFSTAFANTRSGKHQQLVLLLCTLGPLRPTASSRIVVKYSITRNGELLFHSDSDIKIIQSDSSNIHPYILVYIRRDKNVTSRNPREHFIPHYFLGFKPVQILQKYLLEQRPPSGSYLLSAPIGKTGFRTTKYTAQGKAISTAFARTFPGHPLIPFVSGGTPRKSLAQWLWDAGHERRLIADIGGWATTHDAVDGYFRTQGKKILQVLMSLH